MVSPPLPEPGECRLVAAIPLMAGLRNMGSAVHLWRKQVAVPGRSRHYPSPSRGKRANTALPGAFSLPGLLTQKERP